MHLIKLLFILFLEKENRDTDEFIHYISNNPENTVFEDDWSFLRPKVEYFQEDTFLNRVELSFDSKARTNADKARINFLEEILNIMLWEQNWYKSINKDFN